MSADDRLSSSRLSSSGRSAESHQGVKGSSSFPASREQAYQASGGRTARSPLCPLQQRRCANRRSEEHTSELQSHLNLVCRLLLEKKKQRRLANLHAVNVVPKRPEA